MTKTRSYKSTQIPSYQLNIVAVYMGLTPIYVLPGVSSVVIDLLKIGLYCAAVGFVLVPRFLSGSFFYPKGLLGRGSLISLIALMAPGLIVSGFFFSISWILSIIYIVLFVLVGYNLADSLECVVKVVRRAFYVFGVFTVFYVLSDFSNLFDPFAVRSEGLTQKSTGWAIGSAVFFALGVGMFKHGPRSDGLVLRVGVFLFTCATFLSIFLSGGRSGLLATFAPIVLLLIFGSVRTKILGALLIAAIGIVGFSAWDFIFPRLRLGILYSPYYGFDVDAETLDSLSSGRWYVILNTLSLISQKPLLGWGQLQAWALGGSTWVHNQWLSIWLLFGAGPLFVWILFFFVLVSRGSRIFVSSFVRRTTINSEIQFLGFCSLAVIFSALIASQFEASTPIKSFQNTASLWFLVGVLIAVVEKNGFTRVKPVRTQSFHSTTKGHFE